MAEVIKEVTPVEAASHGGEAQHCPSCGYDLRASTDRCSECGLAIDRSAFEISAIPWPHRRKIGRLRAYLKTVWLVTIDSRRIRHELSRPQDDRDASRFRFLNAAFLTVALMIAAGAFVYDDGLFALAVEPLSLTSDFPGAAGPTPGYEQDVRVPWSAGMTLLPAIPVYLAGLAMYVSGMGRPAHRAAGRSAEQERRGKAVSIYAMAPLFWLLPAAIFYAALPVIEALKETTGDPQAARLMRGIAVAFAILFTTAGLFSSMHRSGEWITRGHHAGAGRFFLGLAELLGRFAVGLVMFLGVMPWCVGFWWIAIDSQF